MIFSPIIALASTFAVTLIVNLSRVGSAADSDSYTARTFTASG
jgi:hypothetical protein